MLYQAVCACSVIILYRKLSQCYSSCSLYLTKAYTDGQSLVVCSPSSAIASGYNHTHHDQATHITLSIADATECSFFATFWTSWSNLTLTSTLLTNYCKHSIHTSLQANSIFHLFSQHPFLSH